MPDRLPPLSQSSKAQVQQPAAGSAAQPIQPSRPKPGDAMTGEMPWLSALRRLTPTELDQKRREFLAGPGVDASTAQEDEYFITAKTDLGLSAVMRKYDVPTPQPSPKISNKPMDIGEFLTDEDLALAESVFAEASDRVRKKFSLVATTPPLAS